MTDIAIIGPQGSGKTTLALNLVEHRNYVRIGIADAVKEIANQFYPGIQKGNLFDTTRNGKFWLAQGRELYQDIGAAIRTVDEDAWLKLWLRKYEGAKMMGRSVVVDDLRLVREVDFLRALNRNFKIVQLNADAAKRNWRVRGGVIRPKDITEQEWNKVSFDLSLDTTHLDANQTFVRLHEWMTGEEEA
jgi:hypothetical protein